MTPKQALSIKQETSANKYWLKVPVRAVAYVTKRCNYFCSSCYASDFPSGELNLGDFENIFKKISDWGVLEVVFLGGEPFSRPDFLDIVETARKYNLGTKTSTNASYLTKKNIQKVKEYFNGKLQVSLDGGSLQTNDKVRGDGSYRKTVWGIDLLKSEDINFSIGFVANALNYLNLQEIYKFAQERDIEGLHVMRIMPKGRASSSWRRFTLSNEQWVSAIKGLRKVYDPTKNPKLQIDGTYEYNNRLEPLGKCLSGCEAGRYEITFLSNGDIVPCEMFHEWVLGNIKDVNLEELWEKNLIFNRFRNVKGSLEGKCLDCNVDFCSGCRYQAYILNGGFEKSDPYCVKDEFLKNE